MISGPVGPLRTSPNSRSRAPRAIALDHEVLRVFQQLGVLDAVLPHTEPFTNSEYFGVDGQLIRRMTMVAPPYPQGHTPSVVFTQPPVERILRDHAASLPGVTLALGVEMTGFTQDATGVTLQYADGQTVRARHAVACDGGASGVRTALGITLDDLDFDEPWLVVDVMVNDQGLAKLPITSVQYCEPDRPCTMVIGPGRHRRWEISLKPGEDPAEVATPEATWRLLSRWAARISRSARAASGCTLKVCGWGYRSASRGANSTSQPAACRAAQSASQVRG